MFQYVHAVALYTPELKRATARYQALGLEPAWSVRETNQAQECYQKIGLRYPGGGAELILHDNPERQFAELVVAVENVCEVYRRLAKDPGYLWLEPPHGAEQGCSAFVRDPDGNVLSLISPQRPCCDDPMLGNKVKEDL